MNAPLTAVTATTTDRIGTWSKRHSTAISADKNPARYYFNRHSQVQTSRHPYLFLCHNSGSNNHERDASQHGRSDQFQSQYPLSSFATDFSDHEPMRRKPTRKNRPLPQPVPALVYALFATPIPASTTQANTIATDTWRFFPGRNSPS
jgi:hypothetical protein